MREDNVAIEPCKADSRLISCYSRRSQIAHVIRHEYQFAGGTNKKAPVIINSQWLDFPLILEYSWHLMTSWGMPYGMML